ncbi:MAG: MoaD/ThiS family protein [Bacillota bacterium]
MQAGEKIVIRVEYLGLFIRLAGISGEYLTLGKGSSLEELLETVFTRRPSLEKGNRSLFAAVNKKPITAPRAAWKEILLQDGDQVLLGVKVIGG